MVRSVNTSSSLLALLLALALSGCGEEAEVIDLGPVKKPQDHDAVAETPKKTTDEARKVVVPEGVTAGTVILSLRAPGEKESQEVEVPLGKQVVYGSYRIAANYYLPAFMIEGNTITSDGLDEKNPAVFILWQEGEKQLFAGWTFRDYPSLNPPLVEGYELKMLGVK